MVAEPRARVALSVAQGTAAHVAEICGWKCEVFKKCGKRKISQKGKYVNVRFLLSYGHNEILSI